MMQHTNGVAFGPMRRTKLDLMGIRFAEAGGDGSGAGGDGGDGGDAGGDKPKVFTEAQVAAIVQQRLKQQADTKFGDYETLKTAAEGAKTVEEKLAALETKHAEAEARALRSAIAAEHGISTKKGPKGEPSDADLFLTGSDEATLTAQATRLAAQVADRKKQGNVARKEGGTTSEGKDDGEMREFARALFDRAD